MPKLSLTAAEGIGIDLAAYRLEPLRQEGEFLLSRGQPQDPADTSLPSILVLTPVGEYPAATSLQRLEHEYAVKDELDSAWAVRTPDVSA